MAGASRSLSLEYKRLGVASLSGRRVGKFDGGSDVQVFGISPIRFRLNMLRGNVIRKLS